MDNAANQVAQAQDAAALAQAVHDVRIQATMKALTSQRESASNALVNALTEKAIVEFHLNNERLLTQQLQAALGVKTQETAELRILVLNLQGQLKKSQTEAKPASAEEAVVESKEPEVPAEEFPVPPEETPSLLDRAANLVRGAIGGKPEAEVPAS